MHCLPASGESFHYQKQNHAFLMDMLLEDIHHICGLPEDVIICEIALPAFQLLTAPIPAGCHPGSATIHSWLK